MLGCRVGDFTPFEFEATGKLKATGYSLIVRVNNARKAAAPGGH